MVLGTGEGLSGGAAAGILVRNAERGAAPARRNDVRVLDLEAGAHQALGVVHRGAVHVAEAELVDDDPDAVVLEDPVAVPLLVERQLVLEARAAAAAHGHAEPRVRVLLVREQGPDLLGGYVGESYHGSHSSRQRPGYPGPVPTAE